LPWGSDCPECGEPSTRQARIENRPKDLPLSEMPESFVRRVAFCCIATTVALPILVARLFLNAFGTRGDIFSLVIDIFLAVVWVLGVFVLTRPIDHPEAIRWGMGPRGKRRRIARVCAFSVIGISILSHMLLSGVYSDLVLYGLVAITIVGLICLFLFLAEIAIWVRDLTAKRYLESASWGAPLLLCIGIAFDIIQTTPLLVMLANGMAALLAIGGVIGMMMLTSSVLQAVRHAREYQAYQDRRFDSSQNTQFPSPE